MAWKIEFSVDDIDLSIQTQTGFFGLFSNNPKETLGFSPHDPQIIRMIKDRDPRLFDILTQALNKVDELALVGWSQHPLWWEMAGRRRLDGLEYKLKTISQSQYASPEQRKRALETLAHPHHKQGTTHARKNQFRRIYQERLLALINRDGLACAKCHTYNDLTIDHIMPVSKGGTDDLDNLQLLCRSCNSSKGDRIDE